MNRPEVPFVEAVRDAVGRHENLVAGEPAASKPSEQGPTFTVGTSHASHHGGVDPCLPFGGADPVSSCRSTCLMKLWKRASRLSPTHVATAGEGKATSRSGATYSRVRTYRPGGLPGLMLINASGAGLT